MISRGIPCAALLLALVAAPAHATTTVVPDSFPTVQAGIDSGRDTVFVRSGRFNEDLVVHPGLSLLVYPPATFYGGTSLPQVGSLTFPGPCSPDPAVCASGALLVRGFRFRGPVRLTYPGTHGSSYEVAFETCRMDSGLSGSAAAQINIRTLDVSGCTILRGLSVSAMGVNISLNSVYDGGIAVAVEGYGTIQGNYIHGPAVCGIAGGCDGGTQIVGNTVVATETGIRPTHFPIFITDNEVMDCSGSGIVAAGSGWGDLRGNQVTRCGGYGIEIDPAKQGWLEANQVLDCASGGVRAPGEFCAADSNVVGRCGGPGFDIAQGSLRRNTSYLNQGAGFVVRDGVEDVSNNIACGNLGYGLVWKDMGAPDLIGCNDWYANSAGAVSGTATGVTDVSMDPLFCNLPDDDVHLSAGSPLLSLGSCGRVGALGQGCLEAVGVPPEWKPGIRAFTVSPNPSHGAVRLAWSGTARPEWVDVYDVTGARRWGQAIEPGASRLTWTGTDQEGHRLSAGVYYARLTGKGASAATRVVLVQ